MSKINLKPTHKAIAAYHESLLNIGQHGLFNEGNVSPVFATLLDATPKTLNSRLAMRSSQSRDVS